MARGATARFAFALVAFVALVAVAVAATADSVPGGAQDRAAAASIVARTNAARVSAGVPPLATHDALTRAAERYAREMAAARRIDHIGAGGTTPDARASARGYDGWTVVAENLASSEGAPDAAAIVAAWMASDMHRANVLAADLRDAGAACYVTRGRNERAWCVLDFGAR